MKNNNHIVPLVYFLLAAFYFIPVSIPFKTAYPIAALSLMSAGVCPWQMTVALAFSAAGDAISSSTHIVSKILCFAVAHIFYIVWFISQIQQYGKYERKFSITVISIFFCILLSVLLVITPHAPNGTVKAFSIVYATLLSIMACSAVHTRSKTLASGAILFLISDMLLGWGIFVSHVPGVHYLVMITYYVGQWLIFCGSTKQLQTII